MSKKISLLVALSCLLIASSCSTTKKADQSANKPTTIGSAESDSSAAKKKYRAPENEKDARSLNESQAQAEQSKARIYFGYDSSEISASAHQTLDEQVKSISENSSKVAIEGHCDERGTREYNIALGEARAKAAKDYLVSKGVSAEKISTVSYGKEKPAYFGSSEDVYSKNRRAVLDITN